MSITEEEALGKWCPFVSDYEVHDDRPVTVNRGTNAAHCVGGKCMAWRWQTPYEPPFGALRRGFCGIAGRAT